MSTIARIAVEVDAKTAQFERGMAQAAKTAETVGRSLQRYVTLPLTAIAGASVYVASNYNASMNRVAAVSQATAAEMEQLSLQAKELGRTTRYSAVEAADAMGFLGMAGLKTDQIISAMPSTLQLAAAAQLDLAEAADITTNILTGYSMSTEELGHANDVLVSAFTGANTSLSQLGEAMKYVAPVASGMGQSFEGATTAIALLGNAGIQGSMAGTTLRGALGALANPTQQAASIMQEFGIRVTDSQGQLLQMADIIEQFEKSGIDATKMMELFGLRAGPGMISLVEQGSVAFRAFEKRLESSGGIAQRVADKNMEGLSGALVEMKSVLEGVSLEIGEALTPAILKMVDVVKAASTWFIELEETQRNTVVALGAVAAATGPLLILLGQMPKVLGAIRVGLTLIATHPIVFAVVAIGAAIAGVITYFDAWEETITAVKAAMSVFGRAVELTFSSLVKVVGQYVEMLMAPFKAIAQACRGEWSAAWDTLKSSVTGWGEVAVSVANDARDAFGDMHETITGASKAIRLLRYDKEIEALTSAAEELRKWIYDLGGYGGIYADDFNEDRIQLLEIEERLRSIIDERDRLASSGLSVTAPDIPEAPELPAPNVAAIRPVEIPMIAQQVALDIDPYALTEADKLKKFPTDVADQWLEDQERIRASQALTDSFVVDSSSRAAALQIAKEQNKTAMMVEQQAIRDQMLSDSLSRWGDQFAEFTSATIMNWDSIGKTMVDGVEKQASAWQKLGIIFSQVAKKMLADMAALIARALVLKAITTMLGLPTSGAGGGGSFGGFGSIGGWLTGKLKVPGFAEGGLVTKPTLAMVGEGGGSEAIIPLSKLGDIAAASGFSIFTKGVKGIFGLAEGGIVTQPTLAMVGEGGGSEAIIPLSKLGDVSGGGRPIEVHTHVEVGGREVAEYVMKDIMNNLQRRAAV